MRGHIIVNHLNNSFLRKVVLLALVGAQVCLLLKLSWRTKGISPADTHHPQKEPPRKSVAPLSFEFDEKSFQDTKEKIKEELLSEYNVDPKEAFQNLRRKVSKEERNMGVLKKQVKSVKGMFVQKSSLMSQLMGIVHRKKREVVLECREESPKLLGDVFIQEDSIPRHKPGSKEFHDWYGPLRKGGIFETSECKAGQRVAIIIPFRDREEHLRIWLYNMHPILQRQQIDYQVFVIEQGDDNNFNRGALMNIGYKEALSSHSNDLDFNCFVFQDVDLIPENDRNLYTCMDSPHQVKHLSVAVSKWKYKLIYNTYFGGVSALSKDQVRKINGFANRFYGWGGEDDDFYRRISRQNLTIFRYPGHRSRYTMLKHNFVDSDEAEVAELSKKSEEGQLNEDGLSNLSYKKLQEDQLPLYTRITVSLPSPPRRKSKPKNLMENGASFLMNGLNGFVNKMAKKYMNAIQKEEEPDMIY